MEETLPSNPDLVSQVYDYAANLLVHHQKSPAEVKRLLAIRGLDDESAHVVVANLETQIRDAKKAAAKKDMLHGGLWCAGGLALTLANVGFIFWGAIIFGGIQFFKGVANLK